MFLAMTTELYTSSRLRVLRACLRQHHYRYALRLLSPETELMRFGTIGHAALEAWYRAWMAGRLHHRLDDALSMVEASDLDGFTKAKLRVLVISYHHRWGNEDWEVLGVEVEFQYMLGDRIIAGKIDAIIRDRKDGRVYIVEHKTTGADASLGSPYWERLAIDTQVSIYIDGAAILGYAVVGCIYDVIKRPAHEPKLATPPERREYTKGKGCKGCGGSGGGPKGIVQGLGYYTVNFTSVEQVKCEKCDGTGWLLGADGKPQAPRLHANQRDTDEPVEDFEARLVEAIAEAPDAFLLRGVVVRLEHELPLMRQDLLDAIDLAATGLIPRNPDACARGHELCPFFDLCAGRASPDDFTRGAAHPELAATTSERG